jgi:hypothetical protein
VGHLFWKSKSEKGTRSARREVALASAAFCGRGDPDGREGLRGVPAHKGGQREGPREGATGAFYGARRPALRAEGVRGGLRKAPQELSHKRQLWSIATQITLPGSRGPPMWLTAVVILWPATCRAFCGSLGEPFVIIGVLEHRALGFGIVYLLREGASFLSAVEPVLGIVDWMFGH